MPSPLCADSIMLYNLQVITSMPDDHIPFDKEDAQLVLDQGTPRSPLLKPLLITLVNIARKHLDQSYT